MSLNLDPFFASLNVQYTSQWKDMIIVQADQIILSSHYIRHRLHCGSKGLSLGCTVVYFMLMAMQHAPALEMFLVSSTAMLLCFLDIYPVVPHVLQQPLLPTAEMLLQHSGH